MRSGEFRCIRTAGKIDWPIEFWCNGLSGKINVCLCVFVRVQVCMLKMMPKSSQNEPQMGPHIVPKARPKGGPKGMSISDGAPDPPGYLKTGSSRGEALRN